MLRLACALPLLLLALALPASAEVVELVVEAQDTDRPSDKRRFVHLNIPRHLLSKAMAELARRDQGKPRARD